MSITAFNPTPAGNNSTSPTKIRQMAHLIFARMHAPISNLFTGAKFLCSSVGDAAKSTSSFVAIIPEMISHELAELAEDTKFHHPRPVSGEARNSEDTPVGVIDLVTCGMIRKSEREIWEIMTQLASAYLTRPDNQKYPGTQLNSREDFRPGS
jgi:hypothetical protein